jgi:two-component system probable response regulator PhcQ
MEPMRRWIAPGSTLQVEIARNADGEASIRFEARNCEPSRAMQDSVLFSPAFQTISKSASDLLKAFLAIGHIGGRVSSPPMQNGYKQIQVSLPARNASEHNATTAFPKEWVQELSADYEKWVLGTLDMAA